MCYGPGRRPDWWCGSKDAIPDAILDGIAFFEVLRFSKAVKLTLITTLD